MELEAHAKANLGLSVLGKRADGYHDIDTIVVRLELRDLLNLEPRKSGITLESVGFDVPLGKNNLIVAAAERYLAAAGVERGVHVSLIKRIPVAAGLGGGSSDAAAVLRGMARLYPADVDLVAIAEGLGADVSFFVLDVPAARARGRGERLETLPLPELHLVLVNPGVHVRARQAYDAVRAYTQPLDVERIVEELGSVAEPSYENALQAGVVALEPISEAALEALKRGGLRGASISGSGPTSFALARDGRHAQQVAEHLANSHPTWWTCATRTI